MRTGPARTCSLSSRPSLGEADQVGSSASIWTQPQYARPPDHYRARTLGAPSGSGHLNRQLPGLLTWRSTRTTAGSCISTHYPRHANHAILTYCVPRATGLRLLWTHRYPAERAAISSDLLVLARWGVVRAVFWPRDRSPAPRLSEFNYDAKTRSGLPLEPGLERTRISAVGWYLNMLRGAAYWNCELPECSTDS